MASVESITRTGQRAAIARTAGSIVDRILVSGGLFVLFSTAVAVGYRPALAKLPSRP